MATENYSPGEVRYKIILIGECGAGKTSIFWRYIQNQEPVDPSVTAVDFRYKQLAIKDKKVKLCIWDTAGQERYRSIVATYFKSCDGVVMVFDLSSKKSWEGIKQTWYEMAIKRVPHANYMLLGSKKDLSCDVDLAEVGRWCAERGIYFIQTSAKTGEHVSQAFFTLAALIDCRKESSEQVYASFANSYSSGSLKTETTREADSGWTTETKSKYHLQRPRETSFCLQKQKRVKAQNCCK